MRIIVLGIADDIHQADPVVRALERSGFTLDDVNVLLACADEQAVEQRPVVGMNCPAPFDEGAEGPERRGSAAIAVSAQAAIGGTGPIDERMFWHGQAPLTVTGHAIVAPPMPSGIARDLIRMGIPQQDALQIGGLVRMDNVLLLVSERPARSPEAIIDAMLSGGLTRIFLVTVAEMQDACRQAPGQASRFRIGADRPPGTRTPNHLYF
jgi:hypothetical protein